MNIVILEQEFLLQPKKGLTRFCAHSILLATALLKHTKIKPFIITEENSPLHQVAKAWDIPVEFTPEGLTARLQWTKFLKQNDIQLVHTFDESALKTVQNPLQLGSNLPHIHTVCNYYSSPKLFGEKSRSKLQALVFPSKIMQSYYVLDDNQVTVIPMGIDKNPNKLSLEDYAEFKEEKTQSHKKKVRFLVPGPLYTQRASKEIFQALQIFDQYQKDTLAWEIHFAGIGEEFEQILNIAEEHNLKDYVAVFNQIENEDFFASGHGVILPENLKEPDLQSLLTAYKMKIPVICIGSFPFPEYAAINTHVFVADKDKPASLAGLLHKCVYDTEIINKFTENALDLLKEFSGKNMAEAYLKLYEKKL